MNIKTKLSAVIATCLLSTSPAQSAQQQQWRTFGDANAKDFFTVAYVSHKTTNDMFIVRFDRTEECQSTIGIASKVNSDYEFRDLETKYRIKIDDNTTWFTETTSVSQINKNTAYFHMVAGFDTINQMKEGTTIRIKMGTKSYYDYSLINSSKAINKAEDACRSLGAYVDPNAKYFDI